MTTAIPTQPSTTAVLLFGDTQDTGQALAHALHERGVLGSLGVALLQVSQAGRDAAGDELAKAAHGLLDLDVGELVVAGWRKHAALTAAADRTIANPGSSAVVELATHRITSVHEPSVELLVNDVHVATVHFELRVEFVVKALVATVRNGHVVALQSGICDVTARLAAEGQQLAKRQVHFQLPLLVRLPLRLRRGDGDPTNGAKRPQVPSPQPER